MANRGSRHTIRPEQLQTFLDSLNIQETFVYAVFSRLREEPALQAAGDAAGSGNAPLTKDTPAEAANRSAFSTNLASPQETLFVRQGQRCSKVKLRPVTMKGEIELQAEYQFGPKTFHQQYPLASDAAPLAEGIRNFAEGTIFTSRADYQFHWTGSGLCRIAEQPPTKSRGTLTHNRQKSYLLPEGEAVPFLVELGVMDSDGQVSPKRYDKFRQINKYLDFVEDALKRFPKEKPLYIVDFGSGKAYLTFALYHYLMVRGYGQFQVTGLDLKADVVAFCNTTARRLGYDRLNFEVGDIANFQIDEGSPVPSRRPDMVVSLHACDIATDAALVKALQWGVPAILAVPCCQHEFFHQLASPAMDPIIRYGVTKDKQATLVTDASRTLMLKAFGYSVEMVEFITMEHTPKNVLIRAYREQNREGQPSINVGDSAYRTYRDFLDLWGVGRTYLELELARQGLLQGQLL